MLKFWKGPVPRPDFPLGPGIVHGAFADVIPLSSSQLLTQGITPMLRLQRPNMAINDPRMGSGTNISRFRMWNTWDIGATERPDHIIDWTAEVARTAPGGRLRHLVLNCHGTPGRLHLGGTGFDASNVGLFSRLNGLVDKIWTVACRVAYIDPSGTDGNQFCSALARNASCYFVVSTETQCERRVTLPYDMITSFEGLVLSYGPSGRITWSSRNRSTWMYPNGSCYAVPD